MNLSSQIPLELHAICTRWAEEFEKLTIPEARIEYIRKELPALLLNESLFALILERASSGDTYPDIRQATMFNNEMILYLDRKRLFSIRLYLFGPDEFTPPHDHNSWGILGTVSGHLEVRKYKREDDGSREGYACLKEVQRLTLRPGETDVTLPLNKGIHRTGNSGQKTIGMVSVYGTPLRRLHINSYDVENHRVYKMFVPRIRKRMLASAALKTLNKPGTE